MITWDETKRLLNLEKHRIDLALLEDAFDSPMLTVEDSSTAYGDNSIDFPTSNKRSCVCAYTIT